MGDVADNFWDLEAMLVGDSFMEGFCVDEPIEQPEVEIITLALKPAFRINSGGVRRQEYEYAIRRPARG